MREKITRAAIYVRVSTKEQSIENQVDVLRDWAKKRGFDVVEIYSEQESAWRAGHQRDLARLMEDARKRKFTVVLVWALDRLSREGPTTILTLVDKLKKCGVKIISYQESWTEAPGELGDLLFSIVAWVARQESIRRSERTKAGLARAAKEGKKPGRPSGSKDKKRRKKRSPKVGPFLSVI